MYADRSFREFKLKFDGLLSRIEERRRAIPPQDRPKDAQLSRLYVQAESYLLRWKDGK